MSWSARLGSLLPSNVRLPPPRILALSSAALFVLSLLFYASPTLTSSTGAESWLSGSKLKGSALSQTYKRPSPFTQSKADEQAAASLGDGGLVNATFVILARNSDVWEILQSIRGMEDRFNSKYHYPYVFLNDEPFSDEFKLHTSSIASGPCTYGQVPREHWEAPEWIDEKKAAETRQKMAEANIIYGGSVSYRQMCRYQSGFFWRHPLLDQYRYYWRIEPSVKFFCDINYDPFRLMQEQKKKYGWVVSLYEYAETIPTLWDETKKFIEEFPQYLAKPNLMDFVSNDKGQSYNRCHFWSNFEIADLDFWRGEAYTKYFDHLDRAGGFSYERWGDAPVHSIAAALFLKPDELHYFQDIGYRHEPFQHCPQGAADRCACNPKDENNFETHWYSCTANYKKVANWKPSGH